MSQNQKPQFKDFLLTEYNNIIQTHFKSIETISTSFRYYLLIMTVPISVTVVLPQFSQGSTPLLNIWQDYQRYIAAISMIIALVGLGVSCFIINLRMDSVLYARVVNSIRYEFYNN